MALEIHTKSFDELTTRELYELLRIRSEVFVVEQNCVYQDMDGDDFPSIHLWLTDGDEVLALSRVCPKGTHMEEVSIGRVITTERGKGYGKIIMGHSVEVARRYFGARRIDLEAQQYARGFYEGCGFRKSSDSFILDGIPHIRMTYFEMETRRLILRPWKSEDAEDLYRWAKDPSIGPPAGWPPHRNQEESLNVIRTVFSSPETYALLLKDGGGPIGCVGLKTGEDTDLTERPDECELGYWLALPYWGQGLMTEACREMIRHAFEDLGMEMIWCGHYEGNERSRRVQQRCGFVHHHTSDDVPVPLLGETRKGHVACLDRKRWESKK